jgi:nucleoid-associated protein YgaU
MNTMTQLTGRLFLILVLILSVATTQVFAQQEMTKDEWSKQMTEYKAKVADLQAKLTALGGDVTALQAQASKLDADIMACEDALYAMLGVTRADVAAFDKELTDMEARVAELQRMSDAELLNHRDEIERMNARLGEMGKSKIALIPRYGNRVASLQEKVSALMKSLQREKTYTVGTWSRDRDCLWNIAKKQDIYANAWMWPKIWQGNRDMIKDPDVIKPSWVLKIPEGTTLTPEEKSAANRYYRKRATAPDAGN